MNQPRASMIQKRTKPVNIRVTEEEFRMLQEACKKIGTRNVSELARDAMSQIVNTHRPESISDRDLMAWLNDLDGRLINLQAEVTRMKQLLVSTR